MSSILPSIEHFLDRAKLDRAPWLVVAFGAGIASWFVLPDTFAWIAAILAAIAVAIGAGGLVRSFPRVRTGLIALALLFAAGVAVIWIRSEMVGASAIARPMVQTIHGYVLERDDQPARGRVRLVLASRDAHYGKPRRFRVNAPPSKVDESIREGAIIRLRARLMPPASPMLPGSYDFARSAWFKGLAATGSVIGDIVVLEPAHGSKRISEVRRQLSSHVRGQVSGSAGAIAAAFASGDRGGIDKDDADAMRDAGLTHLLAISGLHVSAVIAAAYLLALKLFAISPWVALRVRLPLVAAVFAAAAGIGYTLLTGSQVPTVRSCVGAVLVLAALAMGREALSMRMVAVAAMFVLLAWPESIAGPSFQMSFAAVIAIVALHQSEPVRQFLAPRDEALLVWLSKRAIILLVTGLVIEIALMPIVLFHFHRAGVYGALANVIAIPLVTFVSMPLIAFALLLDLVGIGAPVWWLVGMSLDLLLDIAHFTASRPGAVRLMPQMGWFTFALFIAGGLWLGLWRSRMRLWGLVPAAIATLLLVRTAIPDILISRDGRHVGISVDHGRLVSLRQSRGGFAQDNLLELAGVEGKPIAMGDWPGARCSSEFCVLNLRRGARNWTLLIARNRLFVDRLALARACEQSDIVIADRYLPRWCKPRWLKADKAMLRRTGGLSIDLASRKVTSVAQSEGKHGWWRGRR